MAEHQNTVLLSYDPPIHHLTWGRYHGGRRPSSDDYLHSPTVIPPSALYKPSIMTHNHRRRTCSHTSPRRSPTMVTLHDTRFVEWSMVEWRLDCEDCRHWTVVGLHDTGPWCQDPSCCIKSPWNARSKWIVLVATELNWNPFCRHRIPSVFAINVNAVAGG